MNRGPAAATTTDMPVLAVALVLALSPVTAPAEVEGPPAAVDVRAEPPATGPIYLASPESSAIPRRLGYRGTSLGFGGAIHFDDGCPADGSPCGPASDRLLLLGTPTFDLLTELGWRHLRAVVGVFVAPVPHENTDYGAGLLFGAQGGLLVGYERLRAGVTVGGGLLGFQFVGRLLVTPWRDRRGHRHGLEAAVGREDYRDFVLFAYRFAPAALGHVGGRRAAMRRAGL
ncbi:MAG: hypothetical protein R3B09_05715 [Nannocystaceae bacterium]